MATMVAITTALTIVADDLMDRLFRIDYGQDTDGASAYPAISSAASAIDRNFSPRCRKPRIAIRPSRFGHHAARRPTGAVRAARGGSHGAGRR